MLEIKAIRKQGKGLLSYQATQHSFQVHYCYRILQMSFVCEAATIAWQADSESPSGPFSLAFWQTDLSHKEEAWEKTIVGM